MRKKLFLGFLILLSLTIWIGVLTYPDDKLHIIACEVGQGDAILVTHKTVQVLIDGGPTNKVINCLSDFMPFWDRTIEIVLLTHPQADHMTGLVEVLRRYNVVTFITSDLSDGTPEYRVLEEQVGGSDTDVVLARKGQRIRSGMIQLDILNPTEEFFSRNTTAYPNVSKAKVMGKSSSERDPNDFSVVALLTFKSFKALMTGDLGLTQLEKLVEANELPDIDYIKIPHHGSKNGLVESLLKETDPEVAVISAGKNNSYGHPHVEILEMLEKYQIKTFRTDEMGEVVIITDGIHIFTP